MTDPNRKPRRIVNARRVLAVGTLAATALGNVAQADSDTAPLGGNASDSLLLASAEGEGEGAGASGGEGEGEGEGEGGGASLAPEVSLMRDLGFMTGHLRAGMALYEAGDLEAAKTHMGHPIEEKYDAVAEPLQERGFGGLKDRLLELSAAAEEEADVAEVRRLFDEVIAGVNEVRADSSGTARDQLMGLAALTRVAAQEYDVAIADDGSIDNLHEYQDSWGFLRTVEEQAGKWADSDDAAAGEAAGKILEQIDAVKEAYGDLQGNDIANPDPSLLFGAAARMELAVIAMD